MTHTFVIAECGSCHDNSFTKALRLIDAAVAAGADAAKFQYWSSAGKLAARRGLGPDAKAVYEKCQLPKSWLPNLKEYCDGSGIEFMCTTYLIEDIAEIAPLVKRYKISAYESTWMEFVRAHSSAITSCNDMNSAARLPENHLPIYCVSKYPTAIQELNLRWLSWDDSPFCGLSDHTCSTLVGALAVAAGATIIEKHLRLVDTYAGCPDWAHSLDPQDFRTYVSNIREAELAL